MEVLKRNRSRILAGSSALLAIGCATFMFAAGCGDDEREFDRGQLFEDMGQKVIMTTVDELLVASISLDESVDTFCTDMTADNLESTRAAWLAAKNPLKRSESFSFGPARMPRVQMAMNVDKWPGRGGNIEAIINSDDPIDADYISGLDYRERTKGYPAVGYLLYGAPDEVDTLTAYTSQEHNGVRRCELLKNLVKHSGEIIAEYHQRWASDGGGYVDQFTHAGASDSFPSEQDALTTIMGTMMFALQEISEMKLREPLMGDDGEPLPMNVEAPYSQTSVQHALWSLSGVEALYLGTNDGLGLSDYVQFRQRSGGVDEIVRQRLEAAIEAVTALQEPFSETVVEDPESVEQAIERVEELFQSLSGEVSTLLGVNPTTVEGDND